jgi:ribonuclease HI
MKDSGLIVHTDGGARGNPGPSACAFVVEMGGEIIYKGSKYLGINTNNFAEYSAFILALEWLNKNKEKFLDRNIYFLSDSELVVRQITGVYKIKNEKLQTLNQEVSKLVKSLGQKIIYKNILRDKNKIADKLVNEELDKNI